MPKKNPEDAYSAYRNVLETGTEWFLHQHPREVTITSRDGLTLVGYFLRCQNARRTVLCIHGYRGSGLKDFGCVTRFYYENKCNLLLIDHRACGKSEGKYITFGAKEKYDCKEWIRWLDREIEEPLPLYLDGVSMGGATALMLTPMQTSQRLRGVIADCGYTCAYDIVQKELHQRFHLPDWPFLTLCDMWNRWIAGFCYREASAIAGMPMCKIPVLFIHGDSDTFVPTEMSRLNYQACGGKKFLLLVKGAGHAVSYLKNPQQCETAIFAFFAECEKQ